jgi:putative salt-induced outer membrane protein YdiY
MARLFALCLCVVALSAEEALGQGRARRTREGWRRQVQVGAYVTEGNRDSAQTRAHVTAKGRGERWESEFSIRGEIGELNGTRNRERIAAELLHRRELSRRAYVAYRIDALHDGIADLDYRLVASSSLGWFAIREERQEMRLEAGPAGVFERKGGDQETYPALRLALYYEARVTAVSRLSQGFEYVPELRAESGAYLAKAFVELRADLDKQIALHLRLEGDYDNRPAEGKQKQNSTFSASISYTF